MARPKGMRKIDGIWYLPNGNVAPSSKGKTPVIAPATTEGTHTPATVIIASQNGAESVTGAVRHTGTKVHTRDEIKAIETKTGLVMAGNISDDCGILVPVFVNPDRNQDWRDSNLTKMRKGI